MECGISPNSKTKVIYDDKKVTLKDINLIQIYLKHIVNLQKVSRKQNL